MENRSKRRLLIISGFSLSSVVGVIIGESWIIALIVFLGPLFGFIFLSLISFIISLIVLFAYDKGGFSNLSIIRNIHRWAKNKEKNINPLSIGLLKTSKMLAFLFSTITAGPFITIIFSKIVARSKTNFYILALASSLIFSLTWTLIYSGAIMIIKQIIIGLVV